MMLRLSYYICLNNTNILIPFYVYRLELERIKIDRDVHFFIFIFIISVKL